MSGWRKGYDDIRWGVTGCQRGSCDQEAAVWLEAERLALCLDCVTDWLERIEAVGQLPSLRGLLPAFHEYP